MCIDVTAVEGRIHLPYVQEIIHLTSPRSYVGTYTFLIRNDSSKTINFLRLLYPHYLFDHKPFVENGKRQIALNLPKVFDTTGALRPTEQIEDASDNVTNISTDSLSDIETQLSIPQPFTQLDGNRICLPLAHPNDPKNDLSGLEGHCIPDNLQLTLPEDIRDNLAAYIDVLSRHDFTAWLYYLPSPIEPGTAHWYQLQVHVDHTGLMMRDSPHGPCVYHKLASSIDVRRTLRERIESSQRLSTVTPSILHSPAIELIESHYLRPAHEMYNGDDENGMINYFELTIGTGNPKEQGMMHWHAEGDIRLRAKTPKYKLFKSGDGKNDYFEPNFDWKSGLIVEPNHPLQNKGFSLTFCISCSKAFVGRSRPKRSRK